MSSRAGFWSGVAAFVIWGTLTVYWKQLDRFSTVELIGWRIAMMTVVTAALTTSTRSWRSLLGALRSRHQLALTATASVLLAINWSTYVFAVVNDQIVETALGYFLAPLGTIAIGVAVLGERLTPLRRLAAVLAVAAVVVLTLSYGRPPWLAIVIAATFSLYGLAKRRSPLSAIDGLTGEGLVLVIPAVVVIAVASPGAGSVVAVAGPWQWLLVLGTGIVTAVPLLLFARAAQVVPFTILGPLNYLVPIINFGLGWFIFGEPMPPARLAGFVLIWFALVAATVDMVRRADADTPVRERLTSDV